MPAASERGSNFEEVGPRSQRWPLTVSRSYFCRRTCGLSPFAKSEASIRATKEEEEEEGGGGGGGRLRGNANSDKKLESISLCSLFISFFASFARVDGLKGEGEGEESFFLPYPFSSSPPFSAARFSLEEREAAWPFPIMETRMSGVIWIEEWIFLLARDTLRSLETAIVCCFAPFCGRIIDISKRGERGRGEKREREREREKEREVSAVDVFWLEVSN